MTPKDETGSKRQSQYRERRKAEGWKQLPIWFSPEAQKVLNNLPEGVTHEQFINDALTAFYDPLN